MCIGFGGCQLTCSPSSWSPHAVPVTAAMTSQSAGLRAAVMPMLQELAPSHAQIHATLDLFPGLTALDLSGLHFCARLLAASCMLAAVAPSALPSFEHSVLLTSLHTTYCRCGKHTLDALDRRYIACPLSFAILYVSAMHVTCCCCVNVAMPS